MIDTTYEEGIGLLDLDELDFEDSFAYRGCSGIGRTGISCRP